jgi:hypothetical protein
MERGGSKSSKDILSDPLGSKICSREACMICRHEDTKGGCRGQGMSYSNTCLACPHGKGNEKESAVYYGETGRSNYERGLGHLRDLRTEKEDSPLWKHCQLVHASEKVEFQMKTEGTFIVCEERQTDEGSRVKLSQVKHVMNSKSEWNQPPLIRVTTDSGNVQQLQEDAMVQGGQAGRGGPQNRGRGRGRGRARGAGRAAPR